MSDVKPRARRIVVGVDGSKPSVLALRWALAQADLTGATVEAIAAWNVSAAYGVGPTVLPGEDLAAAAQQALDDACTEASSSHADVPLTRRAMHGHPAAVLLELSEGADLLVVGSRGHGGFAGALLGSVSLQCVQHAACPVVVVRAEPQTRSSAV